ncbi:ABC transporter ATP-binding protein [Microbacterium sp. M1A1_1b]
MPAILDATSVHKSFPGLSDPTPVEILRDISLSIEQGEFVSIVGPSGSGKSTLLTCLAGLEPLTSGTVRIAGSDIGRLNRSALAKLRREQLGFVFQSYNLIPSLSARENVALPARLARGHVRSAQIDAALQAVGLLDRQHNRPSALSGGQQQRVAIARVLAMQPGLVFADEPTGALDTISGDAVLQLLRSQTDHGRSVVMVTHDLDAAALADRVLVMRDGAVHQELTHPTADAVFRAVHDRPAGQAAA